MSDKELEIFDGVDEEDIDFDYEPTILTLTDEEGNTHELELLDTLEEEDGSRYAALLPYFENPEDVLNDAGELIILKILNDEDDEQDVLVTIDNEDEFNRVSKVFVDRLSDIYDVEF